MRRVLLTVACLIVLAGCGADARPAVVVVLPPTAVATEASPTRSGTTVALARGTAQPTVTPRPSLQNATPVTVPPSTAPRPPEPPETTAVTSSPAPSPSVSSPTVSATDAPTLPVVSRVVDGETFEVQQAGTTYRVRLIGIQVPRTRGTRDCYGPEAQAFVRSLLPHGTPVLLEQDALDRDAEGSLLRHVTVAGRSVAEVILEAGAGTVHLEPPNLSRAEALIAAQRSAQEQSAGLWSACPVPPELAGPAEPLTVIAASGTAAGGQASVTVRTAAGAACSLAYTTPAGTRSRQAALGPRTADATGQATWEWPIARNTRPGTGSATVTCRGVSVTLPITISNP